MLRKFCPPEAVGFWAEEGHGEKGNKMPGWKCDSKGPPLISDTFSKDQAKQHQDFSSILQSKPKKTSLVQHVIEVGKAGWLDKFHIVFPIHTGKWFKNSWLKCLRQVSLHLSPVLGSPPLF